VVVVELLRNNAGHPHGGPGMAQGVESAKNPKDGARSTNEDVGQNSPYTVGRYKWSKHQEK
jgi:hypothetical protein